MDAEDVRILIRVGCGVALVSVAMIVRIWGVAVLGWVFLGLVAAAIVAALVLAVRVALDVRHTGKFRDDAERLREGGRLLVSTRRTADGRLKKHYEVMPDWMLHLYEGKVCPLCRAPIEAPSPFAQCPDCRRWYHEECWRQFGGCVEEGCPSAPEKLAPRARPALPAGQVAVARAIHNVGFCPFCQTPVQAGADHVTCPECKTPYHPDCWQENNGCAVYGCRVRLRA